MAGSVKLGQPVPESNFVLELNSSLPHAAQRYMPSSFECTYLPVNGGSVPWRRNTSYSSGVSCSRHSSSVFSTLASISDLLFLERRRPINRPVPPRGSSEARRWGGGSEARRAADRALPLEAPPRRRAQRAGARDFDSPRRAAR